MGNLPNTSLQFFICSLYKLYCVRHLQPLQTVAMIYCVCQSPKPIMMYNQNSIDRSNLLQTLKISNVYYFISW